MNKKIRDTADRINGLGRPGGYALTNGISKNKISQTKESVNGHIPNNLPQSMVIQGRIQKQ